MKIALFGATGGTGRAVIEAAREGGHEVTAVVRDPSRLPASPPQLQVCTADVLDPAAILPAIAGCDAVVSAIGSRAGRVPTTLCTDSATSIVAAMRSAGVTRLVVVSAGTLTTAGDGTLMRLVLKPLVRHLFADTITDKRGMEAVVRASGLAWTIVRPPRLTDGPRTGAYRTAVERNVRGALRISRADLADCILSSLTDPRALDAAISIG
jgi:putative NADH-flavin reductase